MTHGNHYIQSATLYLTARQQRRNAQHGTVTFTDRIQHLQTFLKEMQTLIDFIIG